MPSARAAWHLLTGEYPPARGGVADYTARLADALAQAGEAVHVWTPGTDGPAASGVELHRLARGFTPAGLAELGAGLAATPGRLLVQYAPHALGLSGMNLPFALWLATRRALWVMFHEVSFPFRRGQRLARQVLAASQHAMAAAVARRAERLFVSTEAWSPLLARLAPRAPTPAWLPVPSNLPERSPNLAALRARLPAGPLVGHFGTYGEELGGLLAATVRRLAGVQVVLFGRGAPRFAAGLGGVTAWPGEGAQEVSDALACCDVLLQPFPDGLTGRRSSLMAALASGTAVVSNLGPLSEPAWTGWNAPALAPAPEPAALAREVEALLSDPERRRAVGERGQALYRERFTLARTVEALRAAAEADGD